MFCTISIPPTKRQFPHLYVVVVVVINFLSLAKNIQYAWTVCILSANTGGIAADAHINHARWIVLHMMSLSSSSFPYDTHVSAIRCLLLGGRSFSIVRARSSSSLYGGDELTAGPGDDLGWFIIGAANVLSLGGERGSHFICGFKLIFGPCWWWCCCCCCCCACWWCCCIEFGLWWPLHGQINKTKIKFPTDFLC